MQVTYRYAVRGSYQFPTDMLRYDRAFPATETDSAAIHETFERRNGDHPRGETVVMLIGLNQPTAGRWDSFGWKVEPGVEVRRS